MERYLRNEERIMFNLRALYERYAYRRYKMNKFEEYDFYAENKQFLVSGNVITFTDRTGRLMALKPDVTLSIARHHEDNDGLKRVYYNENVYRAGADGEFREILQTGLECIGAQDAYTVGETVLLAVKSLALISQKFVLSISHMGLLEQVVQQAALPETAQSALYRAIESKSEGGVRAVCAEYAVETKVCDTVCALLNLHGSLHTVLPQILAVADERIATELGGIDQILTACGFENAVQFDFSLIGDKQYYNGVVFCGYIADVPAPVLFGGRYDLLMKKLGKTSGAVGFAVYLDLLERLDSKRVNKADEVLTYNATNAASVFAQAETLRAQGKTVCVVREKTEGGEDRC